MLHHVSFNARDPRAVAERLAELLCAVTVRAPTPPFPEGSWFVCVGDAQGSYLEVLPTQWVFDPQARGGLVKGEAAPRRTGFHVLLGTPRSRAEVEAIATAAGWRVELVRTPLFSLVKVWVDGAQLLEILPADLAAEYLATFGPAGLPGLDQRLRALESGSV
jgi:hypothetical protein